MDNSKEEKQLQFIFVHDKIFLICATNSNSTMISTVRKFRLLYKSPYGWATAYLTMLYLP